MTESLVSISFDKYERALILRLNNKNSKRKCLTLRSDIESNGPQIDNNNIVYAWQNKALDIYKIICLVGLFVY